MKETTKKNLGIGLIVIGILLIVVSYPPVSAYGIGYDIGVLALARFVGYLFSFIDRKKTSTGFLIESAVFALVVLITVLVS